MTPTVSIIVLAWGPEPLLGECVRSALASEGVDVDVVIVDNGADADHVAAVAGLPGVHLVTPSANLGFAGGCNLGARMATGDTLLFLNSDAKLDPQAAQRLDRSLVDDIGLVMASVRLWNEPDVMNTSGNPWHYLGFVWAGGLNQSASDHHRDHDVTCASGATMAMRRHQWQALGGFDDSYFAYHEDAELSLRVWQSGLRVRFIADAVSYHHYEFSRNPNKQYLLERNRIMSLLTHYEGRTLAVVLPMLVLVELGILAVAAKQGWVRSKIRGYGWLIRNRSTWLARRRAVQAARSVPDSVVRHRFASTIDAEMLGDFPGLRAVNVVLRTYWRLASRLLAR
ncbi:MAG: glycosyl transferase family 2 [Jatrophihabitantaceae bacterium]|nr:glycosyl transferase family 2 [Jatrophihabitantaceae bacterium]